MIREFPVQMARADRGSTSAKIRANRLSCVWIETGNVRQPLAAVWIDGDMHALADLSDDAQSEPWTLCA